MRTKKVKQPNLPVTSDGIVRALVQRLFDTEKRLSNIEQELREHYEMLAELEPVVSEDGKTLMLRVLRIGDATEHSAAITGFRLTPLNTKERMAHEKKQSASGNEEASQDNDDEGEGEGGRDV